ncbi:MAG: DNA replication/repair protein RecF [Motiliproteus sp.]
MAIQSISISDFRNISRLKLKLSPRVNILHGVNGSGKTSILEGVHLLSLGRSFRTSKYKHYIRQGTQSTTLFAEAMATSSASILPVGLQRKLDGALKIRVAGQSIESASVLAELLPVQLLNSDTFLLLEGSPSIRRQFIDWGGFHSDAGFFVAWKAVKRALKQRNSLLKYGKLDPLVRRVWDAEFVRHADALDGYRQAYIDALIPCFEQVLAELIEIDNLSLNYYRGWDRKQSLDEILDEGLERDKNLGYTQMGPQRAELRIRIGTIAASEILSRGQQKLVVSALKLAQGLLFKRTSGRDCIYLIDDLPAELDRNHRQKLCKLLDDLQCQLLLTCVDSGSFEYCWKDETEVRDFHIEEGSLVNDQGYGS